MSITLSAEERQSFEKFYNQRLAEAGGGRTFAGDAEIVRALLHRVREEGLAPNADGGFSAVKQGAVDWSAPTAVDSAHRAIKGTAQTADGNNTKDMLTGIAVLVTLTLAGFWYFGAFSRSSAAAEETFSLTPTVTVDLSQSTPTPIPTLEADLLADISSGVKTTLVTPRTLEISGVSFVVQPVEISDGNWPMPDDPRAVSWVYGTVVNYVFGIEATAENKALLAALRTGDPLLLRTSTGPAFRFTTADTVRVAPQASEIFRQNRPGLTLVLLGDENQSTRVVIRAVYLPDSELGFGVTEDQAHASLGDTLIWQDALQVTALSQHLLPGHTPPAGYVYLAVDYALKNLSGKRLNTLLFQSQISAGDIIYASTAGLIGPGIDYPPLPAEIRPTQSLTTTATYAIPEALARTGAVWHFTADSLSDDSLQVAIPPLEDWLPKVTFPGAHLLADGTLAISVTVTAPLDDLTLPASAFTFDGADLADNSFPWQISGGSSADFMLNVKPKADTFRLELLDETIEIKVQ